MLQGGWFVYASSPALSDNPDLPPGSEQVAEGLLPAVMLPALWPWVLASLSCGRPSIPTKAPWSLNREKQGH